MFMNVENRDLETLTMVATLSMCLFYALLWPNSIPTKVNGKIPVDSSVIEFTLLYIVQ